jgi:ADP-ribose pyrophosphatase YjhB (NUDIX family)
MTLDPFAQPKRKPPAKHPQITTATGRRLACFPAAVLVFAVDTYDRCLLFRRPGQPGWEVVNGALQPGETVTEAVTRELREKVSLAFRAVYLCVLDTYTWVFDANLPPAINICVLVRYQGGAIEPGKEVRDAEFRWWDLREVDQIDLAAPRARWDLLTKAVEMARYLSDARRTDDEAPEAPDDRREDWR